MIKTYILLFFFIGIVSCAPYEAPKASAVSGWQDIYDTLLAKYARYEGVDYSAWKESKKDIQKEINKPQTFCCGSQQATKT